MSLVGRISYTLLLAVLVPVMVAIGCEATKARPPKQADDALLQSPQYGDQHVVLEPPAAASAASSAK